MSTLTIDDRYQSIPYSDLFRTGVDKIAPTLRSFQQTNNPEAQVLVSTLVDLLRTDTEIVSHPHWEAFLLTGLHHVVIDILCEDKTYAPTMQEVCMMWPLS
jgi:hypothetical protein